MDKRSCEWPKTRWLDGLEGDLQKMSMEAGRHWMKKWDNWEKIVEVKVLLHGL